MFCSSYPDPKEMRKNVLYCLIKGDQYPYESFLRQLSIVFNVYVYCEAMQVLLGLKFQTAIPLPSCLTVS
ncbi:MAG: hypothetical protein Q8K40_09020, partial [Ignavibacteria bacterium]|nr:hypothetical protein [Ignavibacteria bacterium]